MENLGGKIDMLYHVLFFCISFFIFIFIKNIIMIVLDKLGHIQFKT